MKEIWKKLTRSFKFLSLTLIVLLSISVVSAEFPISTAPNYQWWPAVAFDGTNYLVVWTDSRADPYNYYDIYGARVSPEGTVLEPSGVAICTLSMVWKTAPDVAFGEGSYLVVWEDDRNWKLPYTDIYGARVSSDGLLLDSLSFPVCSTEIKTDELDDPAIAFDGSNYFVVWFDYHSAYPMLIYRTWVSLDGIVFDYEGSPICENDSSQYSPGVTFNGTNYLAVWEDYRSDGYYSQADIYGVRVTPEGGILDTTGIPICTTWGRQAWPAVATDGTDYLVVWEYSQTNIYGARVSSEGAVLDTQEIVICVSGGKQSFPSVAYGDGKYLVVWHDAREDSFYDIYGARVTQDGIMLDTSGIPICVRYSRQEYPDVSFDGVNFLVVWSDHQNGYDIYGAFVDTAGNVGVEEGRQIGRREKREKGKLYSHPNPFTTSTTITLYHPRAQEHKSTRAQAEDIELKIYDVSGRLVKDFSLTTGHSALGTAVSTAVSWDGKNNKGKEVECGVYFCVLSYTNEENNVYELTEKIIFLK